MQCSSVEIDGFDATEQETEFHSQFFSISFSAFWFILASILPKYLCRDVGEKTENRVPPAELFRLLQHVYMYCLLLNPYAYNNIVKNILDKKKNQKIQIIF
jgi:hypothetical protein